MVEDKCGIGEIGWGREKGNGFVSLENRSNYLKMDFFKRTLGCQFHFL